LSAVTGKSIEFWVTELHSANHAKFKETVSEALIETISPISKKIIEVTPVVAPYLNYSYEAILDM
jgi:hypothetical protein